MCQGIQNNVVQFLIPEFTLFASPAIINQDDTTDTYEPDILDCRWGASGTCDECSQLPKTRE